MERLMLFVISLVWAATCAVAQPSVSPANTEKDDGCLFVDHEIESHQYEASEKMAGIREVAFDERVTSIPDWAFAVNPSLEKAIFGSGLKSIGDNAFFSCRNLEKANIGKVAIIGDGAFKQTGLKSADLTEAQTVSCYAFSDCSSLVAVKFGDKISVVGDFAFDGDTLLGKCHLYSGHIGDNAFMGCSSLKSVVLRRGGREVKTIGKAAFLGCSQLSKLVLPNGLKAIEPMTFAYCGNLTSVKIPGQVKTIGERAFVCSGLRRVVIPASVEIVETGAFLQCENLKKVIVMSRQTKICDNAFDANVEFIYKDE